MDLRLIEKDGKVHTRIKVGNKELVCLPTKMLLALGNPVKISSRFNYYEVEGDLLNRKKG